MRHHAIRRSISLLFLLALAGCDPDPVEPTDAGATPTEDAAMASVDAGPMTGADAGPGDEDAATPTPDAGYDAGPPPATECAESFAMMAGRFEGTAGVSEASGGPAFDYVEHDAMYTFEVTADGRLTIEDTLMGDLDYDLLGAGTITCTVTPSDSLGNIRSILWSDADGRSLNLGYGDSLETFSTFGGGVTVDMRRGAFLFLRVSRLP